MSTAVELFEAIRPEVIALAVDGRAAHKLGLAAQTPDRARAQLEAILNRLGNLLINRDPRGYQGYVTRWVAYHLGEGFSPEDMAHTIVTIGDLVTMVGRRRMPPGADAAALIRDLVRANHAMVRLVVDALGAELARHEVAEHPTVGE